MIEKIICDICKKESVEYYGSTHKGQGWYAGHKQCVRSFTSQPSYLKKFLWHHDSSGSYSPGWYNDVSRRQVAAGGEVIRDYGKKHFVG